MLAESSQYVALIDAARTRNKRALAQLVSLFENTAKAADAARMAVLEVLKDNPDTAAIIGFTGAPGVGKSSLINALSLELIRQNSDLSVAVVAVDPTSQVSGGSLLGDRTRTRFPADEDRLYFRSQPTNLELGGVTQQTFQAVRLLRHFFDLVIVETVGIGQSELTVSELVAHSFLVMQPMGGDQIQFLKSGIMEMPDAFIVNKCDEKKLARETHNMLKGGLGSSLAVQGETAEREIFLTSTLDNTGIADLANHIGIDLISTLDRDFAPAEQHLFERWVAQAYGQFGLDKMRQRAHELPKSGVEAMQQAFRSLLG